MENERLFIVGLPRTGSTLLRSLLNKTEQVYVAPETHYLRKWSKLGPKKRVLRYGDLNNDANASKLVDAMFNADGPEVRDYWRWFRNNIDRNTFLNELLATDRSDKAIFDLLIRSYIEKRRGPLSPDLIVGEKTSGNIYHLPTLFEWYPRVKVIHTFRDPRGIFTSAAKLIRDGKWGVKEKLPSLPSAVIDPFLDLYMAGYISRTWMDAARLHLEYKDKYPGSYHLVRFEEFLQDPENYMRGICEFLEIPFEPKLLEDVAVVGSSFNAQRFVRTGIDQKVAYRWKENINPLIGAWFSFLGRKHLERFGYAG